MVIVHYCGFYKYGAPDDRSWGPGPCWSNKNKSSLVKGGQTGGGGGICRVGHESWQPWLDNSRKILKFSLSETLKIPYICFIEHFYFPTFTMTFTGWTNSLFEIVNTWRKDQLLAIKFAFLLTTMSDVIFWDLPIIGYIIHWCEKQGMFWNYTRVSNCGYTIANAGTVLFTNKYFRTLCKSLSAFFPFLTIGQSAFLSNPAYAYFDHWFTRASLIISQDPFTTFLLLGFHH